MKPLAVCAVFKNEAPFLREWVAYHRAIGFDRFVLYDNGSTDGGSDLVRGWPFVRVLPWPDRPAQLAVYRHFIYNFAKDHEWVAFIDLDEFLLPLGGESVRGLLERLSGFSAVLVHWRVFGPSGWDTPPAGLVIDNYVWRADDDLPVNGHIKSIAKCADLLDVTANPHEFQVKGQACNALGQPVAMTGIQPVACHENLVINHYVTRSRQDWTAKIDRGSAVLEYKDRKYREDLFDHFQEVSHVRDEAIRRFAPHVLSILAEQPGAAPAPAASEPLLSVTAHVQDVGDVTGRDGDWTGKRGGGRRIEGIGLYPRRGCPEIACRDAASDWQPAGTFLGTRGLGRPLLGIALRVARSHRCTVTATFTDGSAAEVSDSDALCLSPTAAPLEAIRITLVALPLH